MNYTPKINKADLIHGMYYKGRCRNASIARWNGEVKLFYYWRNKFGHRYIEGIPCPEDETRYDVFVTEEMIDVQDITPEMVIPFST